MNIRALANAATQKVNPNIPVILLFSGERTVFEDGTVSVEFTQVPAIAQMQPATSQDLLLVDGRSTGSIYKNFYINGPLSGLSGEKSYDKIIAGDKIYKVVQVPENWNPTSGWTKVLAEEEGDYEPEESDSDSDPDDAPGGNGDGDGVPADDGE